MVNKEQWYADRLQRYFDKHYSEFDETVEWYANPGPNQWRFRIYEVGLEILLTCDDKGRIIEERTRM